MKTTNVNKPDKKEVYENRFRQKFRVDEGGCHVWMRACSGDGYGSFYCGKNQRAHRYAWELKNGPIPEGMVIDHLCRNRKCVNVDHLRVVTNRENILAGVGLSAQNARKTHCKRGHPLSGDNLMKMGKGRCCRTCKAISDARYEASGKRLKLKACNRMGRAR